MVSSKSPQLSKSLPIQQNDFFGQVVRKIQRYVFIIRMLYKSIAFLERNSSKIERAVVKNVRANPLQSVALTVFLGMVIGFLLHR